MGASNNKTFNSQVTFNGLFNDDWPEDVIKVEPMFFNASVQFAMENGGPITQEFLKGLPPGWDGAVLDSRVHMLMPGWYPAIPGYHHDDVPRPRVPVGQHFMTSGQPDYDNPRYYSEHLMGLVNGEICPTEFAIGRCMMPAVPDGQLIYRVWHEEVERLLADGSLKRVSAPSGVYLGFNWQTFHAGIKAVKNGWRWFCRLSRNTERCDHITNEIRKQVQVYLEFPMEGW